MAYEIEDIKISQEIFYYLLEHFELREETQTQLYKSYTENENIQNLVKSQGDAALSSIERYGNVIYLIPNEQNTFLGFSKSQLKTMLCKSGATDKDFYLSQFIVLTMLVEFYDGMGSSSKSRDYIKVGELQNTVSNCLKEGVENISEEDEEKAGLAFTNMLEAYEALRSDESGSKAKTTKLGFLNNIFKFLENQGLIEYVEEDEMIKTTKKLDNFMDWNLLNQNNFYRIKQIMGN